MSDENAPGAAASSAAHADRLAATAFFNALLREIDDWRLEADGERAVAVVALDGRDEHRLRITLVHRSLAGRCRLQLPLQLEENGERREIAFIEAVARLLEAPAVACHPLIGELDGRRRDDFLASVTASRDNIAASLAERDDLERLGDGPVGFLMAEQGLLVGHDFHPAPKSRAPFSEEEARAFTPEHRARFRLQWWAIAPQRAVGASSREASAGALLHDLLPATLATRLPEDYCALPLHPWQARFLAGREEVRALLDADELRILGEEPGPSAEEGGRWWYPTSSHRSLWSPQAEWMVKGSLSARLTNSVRVLHADEVMRGLRLDRWWPRVAADIRSRFQLLQEPAWLGWKDAAGEIEEASLALLRDNPIRDGETPLAVLATLTQPLAEGGETLLSAGVRRLAESRGWTPQHAAEQWFDDYCEAVLSPLIRLVTEEGIVLLAHQQNIVLRLDGERPVGVVYRDCQGSGVTEHFFTRYPDETVSADHRITSDMLMRYFPYYVMLNATMAVSAALAEAGLADERALMSRLRAFLEALAVQQRGREASDPVLLEHLLDAPHFAAKGNFFCYLAGINESTLDDPSRIYISVPNPIRAVGAVQQVSRSAADSRHRLRSGSGGGYRDRHPASDAGG
ncbi:IucA/IucC family protein [Kushneria aurantia]|uniref:IucA/IucC family protein n=1 Tax=Kushneria aurantia TaxID=504092 RepID=A0ABV6G8I2_9GAMM|nr:IucA/IucC family protein [Kushneria aurantia]